MQAVRAEERTPVTKTDIGRDAIDLVNRGQEMPFLLGATPAVNFQSDTGLAAGYAYFNIRGIGPTRLNITLDGVPLQDPEDQALYFSNFGDFASVVDSIQVQRGVGTSSVGSASYGGSVNFASVSPSDRRGLEAQVGGGSWGTGRGTLAGNSGLIGGAWGLYARASGQTTNGFRDHSGVDQGTLYYGATRSGSRSLFKLFGFSGREETQLAFLATDEATLEARPAREPAVAGRDGPLRPGLRPGAVHAPRGRPRPLSPRRPTTTAPRAGSASGTAVARTSSSTGSTATSSAWCWAPRTARAAWASTGAPTSTTSRATTSWTWSGVRARTRTTGRRTSTARS